MSGLWPPDRPPTPTHPLPSCYGLLDQRVRNALWTYRMFGHVGFVMGEANAYIGLLEAELAKYEAETNPR
jgi:hypothetical protein